jgi:hypothetical protein
MRKSVPAPLTIPGMPKKGEAAPAVASIEASSQPPPAPAPAPSAATVEPPAPPPEQRARPAPPAVPAVAPAPPPLPPSSRVRPTIAVTARLDEARYERLKRFGGQHRATNQDIIVAALDRFLQGIE